MPTKKAEKWSLKTVATGNYSGIQIISYKVVKNKAQWQELWSAAYSNSFPEPALPKVNFRKEMILAVFIGRRSSGGYSAKITKVEEGDIEGRVLIARWSESHTISTTSLALTAPFHIVKVRRSNLPVHFLHVAEVPEFRPAPTDIYSLR